MRQSRSIHVLWTILTALVFVFLMSPIIVLIFSAFDDGKFFRFPRRFCPPAGFRRPLPVQNTSGRS